MEAKSLAAQLREAIGKTDPRHVAILGVGNVARGDDGFGPSVAQALVGRTGGLVADGGAVPENELPRLARLGTEVVIFVDAVRSGRPPGTLRLMGPERLRQDDMSTHSASLAVGAEFLRAACGARPLLLAAEPADCSLGSEMSDEVSRAVEKAVETLVEALKIPESG